MPFHENFLNTHRMSLDICTWSIFFYLLCLFYLLLLPRHINYKRRENTLNIIFFTLFLICFISQGEHLQDLVSVFLVNVYIILNESLQNKEKCEDVCKLFVGFWCITWCTVIYGSPRLTEMTLKQDWLNSHFNYHEVNINQIQVTVLIKLWKTTLLKYIL